MVAKGNNLLSKTHKQRDTDHSWSPRITCPSLPTHTHLSIQLEISRIRWEANLAMFPNGSHHLWPKPTRAQENFPAERGASFTPLRCSCGIHRLPWIRGWGNHHYEASGCCNLLVQRQASLRELFLCLVRCLSGLGAAAKRDQNSGSASCYRLYSMKSHIKMHLF